MSDEMIAAFDRRKRGLDFGFAVDPLAYVEMHYDAKKQDLYIFDEVYQQKLLNRRAAEVIKRKSLSSASYKEYRNQVLERNESRSLRMGEKPVTEKDIENMYMQSVRIGADSAEPKSIAEMQTYGLNIFGARKGPDSVEYGMKFLSDLNHIYIDKKRCPHTFQEFVSYEYERNREGEFISAYPDKNNHSIDAVRYALDVVKPIRATHSNIY